MEVLWKAWPRAARGEINLRPILELRTRARRLIFTYGYAVAARKTPRVADQLRAARARSSDLEVQIFLCRTDPPRSQLLTAIEQESETCCVI